MTAPDNLLVAPFSGKVYTKGLDSSVPVISILTYPTEDYAGDRVKPDGGDWSQYPQHPYVNWAHRCPIGRGSVDHRIVKHNSNVTTVAVGQTTFLYTKADTEGLDLRKRDPRTHRPWDKEAPYTVDDVLRVSAQAERLIRDDIATGVSIEFDVNQSRKGTEWWDLPNASVLENRPARHFEAWRGLGYAHARQPVNPGCQTLEGQSVSARSAAALEKAIVIAQTGRLPGGELLNPIILKSFTDDGLLSQLQRSSKTMILVDTAVPVTPLVAAQEQPTPEATSSDAQPIIVKGSPDTAVESGSSDMNGDCPSHGCRALFNAAQMLMDGASTLEEDAAKSDNNSVRKYAKKKAAKMRDEAGDMKARAEKLKATFDTDDDTDAMDNDDYEPSTEEKAIQVDTDGAIIVKSFPNWKPVRLKLSNIVDTPIAVTEVKAEVDPEEERAVMKRLKKAMKKVQPYLEAASHNGLI
jgi:hypothetical protein